MSVLHFACTECGKCCSEAPEMSLIEAMRLGDVFIPAIAYRLTRLPKEDNDAGIASIKLNADFEGTDPRDFLKSVRDSIAVRAGTAITGEHGWDSFVFVSARAWHYKRIGCPALKGKLCTVHDRRPSTCRTVPARYDVPESLLVRSFHGMVTRGKTMPNPYECDTSESAPAFFRDDVLVDDAYVKDRAAATEAAMGERELAAKILTSPLLPPPQEIVQRLRNSGPFTISFHAAVVHARELGKIDTPAALSFCDSQMALIEREVAAALLRKRRDERDWTSRFRTLQAAYQSLKKSLLSNVDQLAAP